MSDVGGTLKALETQAQALLVAGRGAEVEAMVRPLLASGSGAVSLWALLAQALRVQGRVAEARPIQEMLVDALPGHLPTRFDLSETLLLLGDFDRGWREYGYRYSLAHTTRIERKVQRPRWDGRPIPGQTLLIHDEQGYGDTFQFLRMVAWARERSQAKVVLEINHEMASIARRMSGFDAITLRGELPPPFDVHCEMMSLPMAMGLKLGDLPGDPMPYLTALPDRRETWRRRLAPHAGLKVACLWAGRPTHMNDANRSVSLATLAPLAQDGVTFFSIQKGPSEGDALAPPPGMNLVSLSPEIRDFEDTAAILCEVDLLISIDSSPVHLAGALGRPAWVMLPLLPDWRWLQGRDDTPWYPSVRLFRQTEWGRWDQVVDRVAAALTEHKRAG
ncbi:glycosyl transferase family 8 [Sphingomonas hengshuiensis]|uniref:Glycosyl transferase family 8 n=1 Tax=Sphingomonas hengshuiensis TaxID=1609977 RepID=A0A7U4LEV2_9SPHN|nr:glycosyl transferase family 8 [Sphingomonas hengshuiensis]AJP71780.1 glycosyl transferase family 8 [Sphingomonas hengshuiensis]